MPSLSLRGSFTVTTAAFDTRSRTGSRLPDDPSSRSSIRIRPGVDERTTAGFSHATAVGHSANLAPLRDP
eukprot:136441-Pyramimonas_sp.AAC.1